ncbi:hypothetical protein CEXT_6101 [Caerostris extrusa]|uniref:Uncharacterized protein n=1 Tax=Caerostris extrusa TaxID=172846 RepID=A0AAV4VC98_CAEEX|nr:hypothetical protein CEXT_6101 [Caerostris extrusa]
MQKKPQQQAPIPRLQNSQTSSEQSTTVTAGQSTVTGEITPEETTTASTNTGISEFTDDDTIATGQSTDTLEVTAEESTTASTNTGISEFAGDDTSTTGQSTVSSEVTPEETTTANRTAVGA